MYIVTTVYNIDNRKKKIISFYNLATDLRLPLGHTMGHKSDVCLRVLAFFIAKYTKCPTTTKKRKQTLLWRCNVAANKIDKNWLKPVLEVFGNWYPNNVYYILAVAAVVAVVFGNNCLTF